MAPTETTTILVADDEPTNLAILSHLLSPHYRVRAVRSGEQALQAAVTAPIPDLILLDIMMPGMNGMAVLRNLKASPATSDIPVIFITAMISPESEEEGFRLGAVDYLTKPITPATALARTRTHLELKQARDRLASQNNWLEQEVRRRMDDIRDLKGAKHGEHIGLGLPQAVSFSLIRDNPCAAWRPSSLAACHTWTPPASAVRGATHQRGNRHPLPAESNIDDAMCA